MQPEQIEAKIVVNLKNGNLIHFKPLIGFDGSVASTSEQAMLVIVKVYEESLRKQFEAGKSAVIKNIVKGVEKFAADDSK